MKKISAVIVDDEFLARENLKLLLTEYCPEIKIIGEGEGVQDAINIICLKKPEVIFLDIRMPSGAEGFELLELIPYNNYKVIFITAFKDYAIKAFKTNAIDYILKPIDIDALKTAVKKLLDPAVNHESEMETYFSRIQALTKQLGIKKEKIAIPHLKGIKIINQTDITRLQADGNCTKIYFKDNTHYLDTRTLKTYESLLNKDIFYRVHKSHIISLNYVTDYLNDNGPVAKLENGDSIPISRNKITAFTSLLKSN